jgi:hypothetical protein
LVYHLTLDVAVKLGFVAQYGITVDLHWIRCCWEICGSR